MKEILNNAKLWLSDTFDTETKTEIQQLIDSKSDDLADRFYKNLKHTFYAVFTTFIAVIEALSCSPTISTG